VTCAELQAALLVLPRQLGHRRRNVADLKVQRLSEPRHDLGRRIRRRVLLPGPTFDLLVVRSGQAGLVCQVLLGDAAFNSLALELDPELFGVGLPCPGNRSRRHAFTVPTGDLLVSQIFLA
jgi:hypothetical protein